VAYAVVHPKDVDTSELATLDLNIYTTELFKLPAGGVGFAFGGQFRREQLTQDVDQINIFADVPGNSPAATTNAGRKDYAFYAEADIPVFSPTFSFPGFYALNLTAAVRYEAFENNDTNVAVPKFGIRWQPFDETLTVRATIGEGFREPSLIELYASPTSALTGSQDILPGPNEGGFRPDLGGPATPVRIDPATGAPAPNGSGTLKDSRRTPLGSCLRDSCGSPGHGANWSAESTLQALYWSSGKVRCRTTVT
jgi:outer membrane receptor protein involved in Fe transport